MLETWLGGIPADVCVQTSGPNGIAMRMLGDVATFDGDAMTRLVILAHQRLIRVELSAAAKGRLLVQMHARQGHGTMFERHPGACELAKMALHADRGAPNN